MRALRIEDPAALDRTATQNSQEFSGRSSRKGRNRFRRGRVGQPRFARRSRRVAKLEFTRQKNMFGGRVVSLDAGAQPFPENATHFAHGLRDSGQRRRACAHPGVVVEADQRDVSRHAKAVFGDRHQRRQRREIRQRLYRRRRRMAIEPFREFSRPCFDIEPQLDDRRIGQAMRSENLAGASAALTNVGEAQRRGGDQDVLVTEVDQVSERRGDPPLRCRAKPCRR